MEAPKDKKDKTKDDKKGEKKDDFTTTATALRPQEYHSPPTYHPGK